MHLLIECHQTNNPNVERLEILVDEYSAPIMIAALNEAVKQNVEGAIPPFLLHLLRERHGREFFKDCGTFLQRMESTHSYDKTITGLDCSNELYRSILRERFADTYGSFLKHRGEEFLIRFTGDTRKHYYNGSLPTREGTKEFTRFLNYLKYSLREDLILKLAEMVGCKNLVEGYYPEAGSYALAFAWALVRYAIPQAALGGEQSLSLFEKKFRESLANLE